MATLGIPHFATAEMFRVFLESLQSLMPIFWPLQSAESSKHPRGLTPTVPGMNSSSLARAHSTYFPMSGRSAWPNHFTLYSLYSSLYPRNPPVTKIVNAGVTYALDQPLSPQQFVKNAYLIDLNSWYMIEVVHLITPHHTLGFLRCDWRNCAGEGKLECDLQRQFSQQAPWRSDWFESNSSAGTFRTYLLSTMHLADANSVSICFNEYWVP